MSISARSEVNVKGYLRVSLLPHQRRHVWFGPDDQDLLAEQSYCRLHLVVQLFVWALVLAVVVTGCDCQNSCDPARGAMGVPYDSGDPNRVPHNSMMPADSPSSLLYNWLYPGANYNETKVLAKDEEAYREILKDAESFNCKTYLLEDGLVRALIDAPRLEWLRVGRQATGKDLTWISRLTRLRGLSLQGANLTDGDLGLLARLTNMQWLDLSHARLPSADASPLPALSTLEFLSMARARFSNDDGPFVPAYPRLRTLLLSETEVLDFGIQSLSSTSPHLRYLDLFGAAGVTDRSLPCLAKLTELEFLHLGKSGVEGTLTRNAKALRELEEHLPRCSILLGD